MSYKKCPKLPLYSHIYFELSREQLPFNLSSLLFSFPRFFGDNLFGNLILEQLRNSPRQQREAKAERGTNGKIYFA